MSDVNAVIVQPFKQFVKVRCAASKTSLCRDISRKRAVAPSAVVPRPVLGPGAVVRVGPERRRRRGDRTPERRRPRRVARRITQHTRRRRAVAAPSPRHGHITHPPRRTRSTS